MKIAHVGVSPATVAQMIPSWLEVEAAYANAKYGDANPQKYSLGGAPSDPKSVAFQEIQNYHGRFWLNYYSANGEERLLLKASQALGKLLSASRALLRVIYEESLGLHREDADSKTFIAIEDRLGVSINSSGPIDLDRKTENQKVVIAPALKDVDLYIANNKFDLASERTLGLIVSQSQLFVDFVCETGIIAVPGLDSSDVNNQLDQWFFNCRNMVD